MNRKSRPGLGQRSIFDTGELGEASLEIQPDPRYAYPQGHVFEMSGRGKGRQSDHSGPIPRAQILAGMTADEVRNQQAVNTEGVSMVSEMMRSRGGSQTGAPTLPVEYIDSQTGHAILGAAASEYTNPHGIVVDPPEAAAGAEPTWAQTFVAEIKSNMQFPYSTRRS